MTSTKYKAALLAPDGAWVTDHLSATVAEVEEKVANQGSRWFFYPWAVVIRHRGALTTGNVRIVAAPDEFADFVGRPLRALSQFLLNTEGRTV